MDYLFVFDALRAHVEPLTPDISEPRRIKAANDSKQMKEESVMWLKYI